jgi:hypothetical protein
MAARLTFHETGIAALQMTHSQLPERYIARGSFSGTGSTIEADRNDDRARMHDVEVWMRTRSRHRWTSTEGALKLS